MTTEDMHREIAALLRAHAPEDMPPPALAENILRALDQHRARAPRTPWWPWLALPPAAAAVMLLSWHHPAAPQSHVSRAPIPEPPAPSLAPAVSLVTEENPLQAETNALTRDAQRARGFLIDCLPSFPQGAE